MQGVWGVSLRWTYKPFRNWVGCWYAFNFGGFGYVLFDLLSQSLVKLPVNLIMVSRETGVACISDVQLREASRAARSDVLLGPLIAISTHNGVC